MATYFHSNSEIQGGADGLQTLVLMNPGYVQYSDTSTPSHGGNLVFLNSAGGGGGNSSLSPQNLPHAPPPHTQQFVGVPLSAAAASLQEPPSMHHEVSALHGFLPRMQYNLWNAIDPNAAAREASRATQGLSLSLQAQAGDDMRVSGGSSSSASGVTNGGGVSGIQSVLLSSKYLKATQELLDEVVNVNGGIKVEQAKKSFDKTKVVGESSTAASGDGSVVAEGSGKRSSELSTTERQEIQMKKAKLISMLDEVEQRYRQYHNQMQIVISSFEQAAGIGSARTYTALALQTISKQFRCLKDAITGQIRAANKSLGEEDCFGGKIEGSRLKYVDHHLRQQRAIQQLGMIHHNAWRPQRGLPERSVSVLRAWLFEHFLHPYPKDSDKHMLAKQTGLTRSQVSNWFINARVRLWKPMVEEMYMEEMKEHEVNGSEDKSSKSSEDPAMKTTPQERGPTSEIESKSFNSKQDVSKNQNTPIISASPPSTSPVGGNVRNQSAFSFIGSSELDGITQGSPKKPRNHEILHSPNRVPSINMDVKVNEANNEQLSMDGRQNRDGYSFMGNQTNFIGGFGQYPMEEIGRFDAEQFTPRFSGNGVSLTLGLPHCETLSGTHQTFLPSQNIQLGRGLDIGEPNQFGALNNSNSHSSTAFESINMQNPKRFAAQLLPDFVA
ncbi:BEL1-like homeodomain protein 1 isoform X1 [Abrus precatorius]|uniref:BEL1-like homeodomain protein 1 isoform X1 n=1 Tax=Abrus precatorius TaxID=3816 RepID=A0A8B8MIF7_ABRPR|nr:BEL1-like homeodomain protein 1 isoform X1 [Abrus precatorius]XP_027367683.1 BEL1-like homeodomain protein 1 isoform X1 [Abrus precatorius]XP_027367684.1 BEL1-like homeodomain protein 1 isoform X1 [Abrus precatorius]XP_027367686.1 BEL1-like homeodomain protein 1 isoform X1 [Abrus precatorius]XP_027367687.1 BEL1-like homeodomain protein 1 isoform X1 [Abrus precatorius]XP_027367688.1 BEL1-like homeodomain protein 1 isoform X1 [Abrus precatorius]XP_027367689.1 BEL1-like homeodomain protein 1 